MLVNVSAKKKKKQNKKQNSSCQKLLEIKIDSKLNFKDHNGGI